MDSNPDSLNIPVASDQDAVQLPAGVTGKDNYLRYTLAVGVAAITIFRHESLTSEQVIDLLVKHTRRGA